MAYKVSVAVTLCDSDWKKCSLIIPCKYIFYLLSNYQHSFSKKKHAVIVGYIRANFWRHCTAVVILGIFAIQLGIIDVVMLILGVPTHYFALYFLWQKMCWC